MKFAKDFLEELYWAKVGEPENIDGKKWTVVRSKFFDKRRWSITWEMVFTDGEKYWAVCYDTPATESQDCDTWSVEKDGMVECQEVVPVQVTETNYVPVKGA